MAEISDIISDLLGKVDSFLDVNGNTASLALQAVTAEPMYLDLISKGRSKKRSVSSKTRLNKESGSPCPEANFEMRKLEETVLS